MEELTNQENLEYTALEIELNAKLIESEDKYVRLYAEFENYKRRVQKEKEEFINSTKAKVLSSILDMDNDFNHAIKTIKNTEALDGIKIIHQKLISYLQSQGIEEIQTTTYDEDVHEVISVLSGEETKILDVVSKGYSVNGKPFRYPKIVLQKK